MKRRLRLELTVMMFCSRCNEYSLQWLKKDTPMPIVVLRILRID